jgi:transposase
MTMVRQAVLLAGIGDVACFRDDRQLRKLLGWYPEARESGSSLSKHRLGRSGNRMARRELWLWTWELISPAYPTTPFRHYYRRLRERGMAGRVAMGHLAGKLVSVLFHCLRSGVPYDPQRHARDLGIADV